LGLILIYDRVKWRESCLISLMVSAPSSGFILRWNTYTLWILWIFVFLMLNFILNQMFLLYAFVFMERWVDQDQLISSYLVIEVM